MPLPSGNVNDAELRGNREGIAPRMTMAICTESVVAFRGIASTGKDTKSVQIGTNQFESIQISLTLWTLYINRIQKMELTLSMPKTLPFQNGENIVP